VRRLEHLWAKCVPIVCQTRATPSELAWRRTHSGKLDRTEKSRRQSALHTCLDDSCVGSRFWGRSRRFLKTARAGRDRLVSGCSRFCRCLVGDRETEWPPRSRRISSTPSLESPRNFCISGSPVRSSRGPSVRGARIRATGRGRHPAEIAVRLGRRWIITRHAYCQWERTCGMRPETGLAAQSEVTVLN
jgi:hypothetical protein